MEARRSTVAGALLGSCGPRRSRKAFRAATLPRHGPCESVASRLNGHGRRRALLRLGVKRAAGQHWRRLARATWVEPSLWVDHSQWGQGRWAEAVAGPAPPRGNDVPSRPEPPRRSGQAGGFCHCYGTGAAEGAPAVGAHAGRVDGRPPRRLMAAKGQHQIRGARHLQLLGPSGWRFTVDQLGPRGGAAARQPRFRGARTDSPTGAQPSGAVHLALCLTSYSA